MARLHGEATRDSPMKGLLALLLTALVGALAPQPLRMQDQRPTFRAAVDAIAIDVAVERRNVPVVGLSTADFVVTDNGEAQDCVLTVVDQMPVDVSLVFDRNHSSQISIGARFASDLQAVASLLRPVDRLRVITFARDVREVWPMQPPQSLPNLTRSPTAAALLSPGRQDATGLDFLHDPPGRLWSLFDALLFAMARPTEVGRRHLVVGFVLGRDTGSVMNDGSIFDLVAARTEAPLHVAIWNRHYLNGTADAPELQYGRIALTAAVVSTGGLIHDNASDVVAAFKSIFASFRQSYVLTYTLKKVPPGGWHAVIVKTPKFPEYTVRARTGYFGQ